EVVIGRQQQVGGVREGRVQREPGRIAVAVRADDRQRPNQAVELAGDGPHAGLGGEQAVVVEDQGPGHVAATVLRADVDTRYRRAMSLPRLSDRTLAQARNGAWPGAYERAGVEVGVAHIGPGAFHRAHQAPVFDALLAQDPRCGVCEIALRSDRVRQALAPQDGLYTLVELGAEPRVRIIGAIKQLLTAADAPAAVLARLADV